MLPRLDICNNKEISRTKRKIENVLYTDDTVLVYDSFALCIFILRRQIINPLEIVLPTYASVKSLEVQKKLGNWSNNIILIITSSGKLT